MDLVATFPPETTSPAGARRFVDAALRADLARTAREVIILLTSELAANAVMHARTTFEVHLRLGPDRIRVEVADENPRAPFVAEVPVDAASGRGLGLVGALADDWGVESEPSGKVVWFEVPARAG